MIDVNGTISKTSQTVIKVAAVVGALTVLGGAYNFYRTNIWRPNVTVLDFDSSTGKATVKVGFKTLHIEGAQTYLIGADWGVRFGSEQVGGRNMYNSIELIKKGMIFKKLTV